MKNLQYIELFEAFKSKNISNTLNFIKDKEEKANFINSLKMVCDVIGFPYSELNDDYFNYLPFRPALKVNSSSSDGPKKCEAESKWIKGEFCKNGKVKRTWGKIIRMTTCPVCKGSGTKSNKPELSIIKFWFNSDGNFVATTGVDGIIRKIGVSKGKKLSESKKNYNVVGKLTSKEFFNLKTGSYVIGTILNPGGDNIICYVINSNKGIEDGQQIFLLQNHCSGSRPAEKLITTKDQQEIAKFSWSTAGGGDANVDSFTLLELKKPETDPKGEPNPYEWNVGFRPRSIDIDPNVDVQESLEDAHFAIVMNFDKIKSSKYTKKTQISKERAERKSGSKLTITDDDVRKQNIERYLATLSARLDISENIVNCNKLIMRSIGYKNAIFLINSEGMKHDLDRIIISYLTLMKSPSSDKKKYVDTLNALTNELVKSSMRKSSVISRNISEIKKRIVGTCWANKKEGKIALEVISKIEKLSQEVYNKVLHYNIECIEDFDILIRKFTTIKNVMRSERYNMRYLGPFFDYLSSNDVNAPYQSLMQCNGHKVLDGMDSIYRLIKRT